jgi:hypothetical protein
MEEFAQVLAVLGTELSASVQAADRDIVDLAQAFQQLARANERTQSIARNDPALGPIGDNCAQISASLREAIIALQCHDRLAQRVGHIRAGLDHLRGLLQEAPDRSCDEWLGLLRQVEDSHRAEQERLTGPQITPNGSSELF